jgi:hypothetical protein
VRCPHCGEVVWTPQQAYQHTLLRQGLCVECKQENTAGGWFCRRCKAVRAAKQRDRRARRAAQAKARAA